MSQTTDVARGWGLRVGGSLPYLAYTFARTKEQIAQQCILSYQRPMQVVVVPLREYRRLVRNQKD